MQDTVLSRDDAIAILEDHNERSVFFGTMDYPDATAIGYNPVCGDRYQVFLRTDGQTISRVQFHGFGCVLSRASASMMAGSLAGMDLSRAATVIEATCSALINGTALPSGVDEDIQALLSVHEHPSRLKCVLLPWKAAAAALRDEESVTTE